MLTHPPFGLVTRIMAHAEEAYSNVVKIAPVLDDTFDGGGTKGISRRAKKAKHDVTASRHVKSVVGRGSRSLMKPRCRVPRLKIGIRWTYLAGVHDYTLTDRGRPFGFCHAQFLLEGLGSPLPISLTERKRTTVTAHKKGSARKSLGEQNCSWR